MAANAPDEAYLQWEVAAFRDHKDRKRHPIRQLRNDDLTVSWNHLTDRAAYVACIQAVKQAQQDRKISEKALKKIPKQAKAGADAQAHLRQRTDALGAVVDSLIDLRQCLLDLQGLQYARRADGQYNASAESREYTARLITEAQQVLGLFQTELDTNEQALRENRPQSAASEADIGAATPNPTKKKRGRPASGLENGTGRAKRTKKDGSQARGENDEAIGAKKAGRPTLARGPNTGVETAVQGRDQSPRNQVTDLRGTGDAAAITGMEDRIIPAIAAFRDADPHFGRYLVQALADGRNAPPIDDELTRRFTFKLRMHVGNGHNWRHEALPRMYFTANPVMRARLEVVPNWTEKRQLMTAHGVSEEDLERLGQLQELAVAVRVRRGPRMHWPRMAEDAIPNDWLRDMEYRIARELGKLDLHEAVAGEGPVAYVPPKAEDYETVAANLGYSDNASAVEWHWTGSLGSGGQGHVGLWIKADDNYSITERVAVKENWNKASSFHHPHYWAGEPRNRVPLEVDLHRRVSNRMNGSDSAILRFLSFAVYETRFMHRTYCEYCPHGDLEGAIANHHQLKAMRQGSPKPSPLYHVPTPALWSIFYGLARTACVLAHGYLPGEDPPNDWIGIVHRDLKTSNVFLSAAQPFGSQSMPLIKACIPSPFELQSHADKVKTGDFGLATTFRDEGLQALGVGTRGYAAPEQWNDGKYYKKLHPMIIGSAADVWGVGIIMHCAIRLNVDDEMEKQCYANAKKTWPVSLDYYKTLYPKTMIDLITKCLDVDPTKRIKAWDLCEAVDEAVDTFFQNPYLDLSEYDEEDEDDRSADKLALLSNKFRYQPDMYAAWA